MNRKKPEVGQVLYSLNIGTRARYLEQVITPVTVTKVGRKYFSCRRTDRNFGETKFHLDSWKEVTDYMPNEKLYESEQEWLEEKESSRLFQEIAKAFQWTHMSDHELSLKDLQEIANIIRKAKGE